jgi:hypothetical protein
MNFSKIKESYQKESKKTDKSIKYKYDPRPKLKEDSKNWQLLLKEAEKIDRQLYGNLHGFRCIGAKLQLEGNKLKLISETDFFNSRNECQEYRKEFLLPFKKEITKLFNAIVENI